MTSAEPMDATNNEVALTSIPDLEGRSSVTTKLTPVTDTRTKAVYMPPDKVIPIIFIPGIMGTNLKNKETGDQAWRPPNMDHTSSVLGAVGQLASFWFKGPKARQLMLDPAKVEIDPSGPVDAENVIKNELAQARNWGAVMRSAYNPIMADMQRQLNDLMLNGQQSGWSVNNAQYKPEEFGDEKNGSALTADEIKHSADYHYEVWAGGYNWLKSSKDSAEEVKTYIEETVLPFYKKSGRTAEKVIIVTHSMGGIVSRALTEISKYERVLGVVHGAQPATGAPADYKRVRAGFESVESVILGWNAAEVTAVLANAPGGLELLPFMDYGKNANPDFMQWLRLEDSAGKVVKQWPTSGDAYTEIYKSTAWYGLIPSFNEKLIDPAKNKEKNNNQELSKKSTNIDVDRVAFDDYISKVKIFHESICGKYYSETFSFYGADKDKDRLGWRTIVWKADGPLDGDPEMLNVQSDNGEGKITLSNGTHLRIQPQNGPADGTVPDTSGMAPGQANAKASFRQGNTGHGDQNTAKGYDHQAAYNDPRARWATIYSIIKISQRIDDL